MGVRFVYLPPKFAQVREPGRNGPAVTRSLQVGRGGSNTHLCTMCQRARIGIAACLRNRCLRVRISPLAPTSFWHTRSGRTGGLEPWINRLAFQGEDSKHALVDATKRFLVGETLQRFY